LTYFGRTTASISHELKNALAIIKENAGLIGDYLLMAEKGVAIEPARFKTVAGRIEDQITRADGIIKNLNRFAHSVDDPVKAIDLNDTAALLGALSQREAAMRQVALQIVPESTPVIVTTAPYLLLTLLGRCLSVCLQYMGSGRALTVRVTRGAAPGCIVFESLDAAPLAGGGLGFSDPLSTPRRPAQRLFPFDFGALGAGASGLYGQQPHAPASHPGEQPLAQRRQGPQPGPGRGRPRSGEWRRGQRTGAGDAQ
jgi:hypothetical protein